MLLLESAGVELEGAEAVVIGRSNLFGKPMAQLLLGANATVTICHSRTRDLPEVCARADVLIAAVGRPQMVKARLGQARRDRDRRRHQPPRERASSATSTSTAASRARRRDHAGPRRRRADDDRVPAAQHRARGAGAAGERRRRCARAARGG